MPVPAEGETACSRSLTWGAGWSLAAEPRWHCSSTCRPLQAAAQRDEAEGHGPLSDVPQPAARGTVRAQAVRSQWERRRPGQRRTYTRGPASNDGHLADGARELVSALLEMHRVESAHGQRRGDGRATLSRPGGAAAPSWLFVAGNKRAGSTRPTALRGRQTRRAAGSAGSARPRPDGVFTDTAGAARYQAYQAPACC